MKSENTQSKKVAVRNKFLANGLGWITGQRYWIDKDVNNPAMTVYLFDRTPELEQAMTEMNQLKQKHSN